MVRTISPAVCRRGGKASFRELITVYTLFQVAGALVTGLVFSCLGMLLRLLYTWDDLLLVTMIGLLATIGGLKDLQLLPVWVPNSAWQVPQSWKRLPPHVMAACYGFGIGLGVLTWIPFAGFHFLILACVGLANIPCGLSLMALYGLSRALTVAFVACGQGSADRARTRLDMITRLSPLAGYLGGLLLAFFGGLFLTLSVRSF